MSVQTRTLLACAFIILSSHSARAQGSADDGLFVTLFDTRYKIFADNFQTEKDPRERLQLIKSASSDLNQIIRENATAPGIEKLLPRLESVRIVSIDESIVKVIDSHQDPKVRARALLAFARYAGNNERHKTCKATLDFLAQQYGDLPIARNRTYAQEAEESKYFYEHLAVGAKAPAIVGEDVDGVVFRLSDYRGKVVMLRFWGDWCPACRAMYPYERNLVQEFKNLPFALVGVNSDSKERCRESQVQSNLAWRTIWDGGTSDGPVASVFRVHNWPTIVVIDADGIVRYRSEGLDKRKLKAVLNRWVQRAQNPTLVSKR